MDTTAMLKPSQLPFGVPSELETAIVELAAAYEREDWLNLDCYLDEVQGAARLVSEEHDAWVRWYYTLGGWKEQGND